MRHLHYHDLYEVSVNWTAWTQTALQVAIAANHHLIVQDLVTHGANVNTRDLWGRSPLHVCAQKGHLSSLQVRNTTFLQAIKTSQLTHSSFRPSGRQSGGPGGRWTPECTIMMVIYINIPLICIIQTSGNDLLFFPEGLTALHTATMSHNAVLKELRDQKYPCTDGKTELEQRCQMYANIVKRLLLMGASLGSKVSTTRTECPVCTTVTEPGGHFCRI